MVFIFGTVIADFSFTTEQLEGLPIHSCCEPNILLSIYVMSSTKCILLKHQRIGNLTITTVTSKECASAGNRTWVVCMKQAIDYFPREQFIEMAQQLIYSEYDDGDFFFKTYFGITHGHIRTTILNMCYLSKIYL